MPTSTAELVEIVTAQTCLKLLYLLLGDVNYKYFCVYQNDYGVVVFLAYDFCRFCVVNCFFIPARTANHLWLRRISIPDFIHYIFVLS